MDSKPNPQGKGQAILLRDLESISESIHIRPKSAEEVSNELFTALFILHSYCPFNAIPGNTYYLYRLDGRYQLMLTGPDDWFSGYPGQYWGECSLQQDLSWSLKLSDHANCDSDFQKMVSDAKVEFQKELEQSKSLENALPFHAKEMSYHQRVLAFALSKSLYASMQLNSIAYLSYDEAKKELKE